MMKDLTGQRFGRIVVIRPDGKDRWGNYRWLCKCDCGTEFSTAGARLHAGNTKSCGCLRREMSAERRIQFMKSKKSNNG